MPHIILPFGFSELFVHASRSDSAGQADWLMEFVTDLHLHSKYSRAVSQEMVLPVMAAWAKKKGIDILSTADWTHPLWFREIQGQLEEKSEGLFQLKSEIQNPKHETNSNVQNPNVQKEPLFLLSVEVSSIYSQGGQLRRIHNLILSPSFATAEKINRELLRRGCNLMSDGRPIIGLSAKTLLELVLEIDTNALLIPCHAWTPWFSLYGSNSGFNSIDECFGQFAKYIYGVETGLSSDPEMNWRIKELDNRSILSFSDAHSPAKMGREATVFKSRIKSSEFRITYNDIISAIKKDPNSKLEIGYTLEFYPEEGKYHYTGHRNCKIVQTPEETRKNGTRCPVCGRGLTVGVMQRVEDLSQREVKSQKSPASPSEAGRAKIKTDGYGVSWFQDESGNHPPFVKLVPLLEIIAEALSSTTASIKVRDVFDKLTNSFGSEINVLLRTDISEIEKVAGPRMAEGIQKVRSGDIVIAPGFDGEYGKVKIWNNEVESSKLKVQNGTEKKQLGLF